MSKSIQLQIPEPCHERWNEMSRTEQGRFCLSCQKQVVDFSIMTDEQIFQYVSKTKEKMCGHFAADQLNRNISQAQPQKLSWLKYFVQFILPAVMMTNRSAAQDKIKLVPVKIQMPCNRSEVTVGRLSAASLAQKKFVSGRVTNNYGEPVAFATVTLNTIGHPVVCDTGGNFRIEINSEPKLSLIVTGVGYKSRDVDLQITDDQRIEIVLHEDSLKLNTASRGAMTVVQVDNSIFKKIKNCIKLPTKTIDTVKIFPNPVSSGSVINLDFEVSNPGKYTAVVFNLAGQPVLQKKYDLQNRKSEERLEIGRDLQKGIYTIEVINLSTKKIYTNKMLVL